MSQTAHLPGIYKLVARIASLLVIIVLPIITTTIAHASPSWLIETLDTGEGNVGEYSSVAVDIGGHRSFFTIVEQASPEETSNTRSPMSAAMIAFIAAGSLVAAFLLYLLVIYICRRRYYR
jgi:hypothetical protein